MNIQYIVLTNIIIFVQQSIYTMLKKIIFYLLVSISSLSFFYLGAQDISFKGKDFSLEWNINKDAAVLMFEGAGNPVWQGAPIRIVRVEGNRVVVREAPRSES